MTVVNPKSISGINSITMASGSDDLLTIHSNNTTERVRVNNSGDVIVGSGVTLSPDGDIFATGVTTSTTFVGNLTGNVTGTLQTAAQTNITSVGSLSSLVVTGGITATGGNIVMNDSSGSSANRIKFGTSQDLSIYHDGSHSRIDETGTGNLMIQSDNAVFIKKGTSENIAIFNADGAVELYHDNTKKLETSSGGVKILNGTGDAQLNIRGGSSDGRATLQFISDDNNANNDNFRLRNDANNDFYLQNYSSGSWETNIKAVGDGAVELYHDNTKQCETSADGLAFPSGKGINFNATADASGTGITAGSETLDDYEEGTFTPRIQTSNGNWGGGYSNQEGSYTKIGNVVNVRFRVHWSSVSGSGTFRITALPFTVANTGSNEGGGATIGPRSGFSYPRLTSFFRLNTQLMQMQYVDGSGGFGSFDLSVGVLASTGYLYCSGWYEVA